VIHKLMQIYVLVSVGVTVDLVSGKHVPPQAEAMRNQLGDLMVWNYLDYANDVGGEIPQDKQTRDDMGTLVWTRRKGNR
jgi:hypothetical protein